MNKRIIFFLFLLLALPISFGIVNRNETIYEDFPNYHYINHTAASPMQICNETTSLDDLTDTYEGRMGTYKVCATSNIDLNDKRWIRCDWNSSDTCQFETGAEATQILYILDLDNWITFHRNRTDIVVYGNTSNTDSEASLCLGFMNTENDDYNDLSICVDSSSVALRTYYFENTNQEYTELNMDSDLDNLNPTTAIYPRSSWSGEFWNNYTDSGRRFNRMIITTNGGLSTAYVDWFRINYYEGTNELPNLTLGINDTVQCINTSLVDSTTFDMELSAVDSEGDTIYYAQSTQGSIFQNEILFSTSYEYDNDYYYYGNNYVSPRVYLNQSWGNGLDWIKLSGNFSQYNGVLAFNQQNFPNGLSSEYYGIEYSLNQFYEQDPIMVFGLWENDDSEFTVRLYNGLYEEIMNFTINQTGLTETDTNATLRVNDQETEIILNQTFPYFSYYMINSTGNDISISYCNQGQGCTPSSLLSYTLLNTTTNDINDINYIRFNIERGAAFLDSLLMMYPDTIEILDWSTTPPTNPTYQETGVFLYKVYVTDSVHLNSEYNYDYEYLTVEQCAYSIPPITDTIITGPINVIRSSVIDLFTAVGYDVANILLWIIWGILILTGIIGIYGSTHMINLSGPVMVASVLCGLVAYLGNMPVHLVTFIITFMVTIARPIVKNFTGEGL